MVEHRTSYLAGETKRRGLLSGRRSRAHTIAWMLWAVATALLILFLQVPGLAIAGIAALGIFLATIDLDTGMSPWRRVQQRRRVRLRRRLGLDNFIPYELIPEHLVLEPTEKAAQREWLRERAAYREVPDGVDGLMFLEARPRRVAVAYHAGRGEQPYCSVTFSVDGPIQGLQGDAFVAEAQQRFGELLAGWGSAQKLITGVQVTTRVIPSDSALHEAWLERQLDPDAPAQLRHSYAELLDTLAHASFVQRHFVTLRWDHSDHFRALAAHRAPGADGWLELVNEQLASAVRRLRAAGYSNVQPLSGPRLGAVLRHLQHPDWPIDQARDVNVTEYPGTQRCWLPSHDEPAWTETVAESPDPLDPDLLVPASAWLHRTAEVPAKAMELQPLTGLWMSPLVTGFEDQVVRTISTHIHLWPARMAKPGARQDATSDAAEIAGQRRKGKIVDDESETALTASQRRYEDLRSGGGHHGATWRMFVTISARSREDLIAASAAVTEAADQCGIARLDWLDSQHSAAQALTWPLARAITPEPLATSTRIASQLSMAADKDGISV